MKGQDIVCPNPDDFSPCSCFDLYGQGLTSYLWCFSRSLNDSRASEILSAFLTVTPAITPLGGVTFYNNSLTRVPIEIALLSQLKEANFYSNQITSIQSGAFNFVPNLGDLDFANNQLSSIEPGAFQGIRLQLFYLGLLFYTIRIFKTINLWTRKLWQRFLHNFKKQQFNSIRSGSVWVSTRKNVCDPSAKLHIHGLEYIQTITNWIDNLNNE